MYDKKPIIEITDDTVVECNKNNIIKMISEYDTVAIECYPGTDYEVLKSLVLNGLADYELIHIDDFAKQDLNPRISEEMTDDRVFGYMTRYKISQFYNLDEIKSSSKKTIIYGFGASLLDHDLLIYADLPRWEIQMRYRSGLSNWNIENPNEDNLKKFKRGYFFEWRMADRHKKAIFNNIDFFLDLTEADKVKMIDSKRVQEALRQTCNMPFRLVPFFDPSVWGGTWMEENCNLEPIGQNYGWSFDGVPEENSIRLQFGPEYIELPAMTLVKYLPKELLGVRTYYRFGDEFPIRFDFLDTIDGENLSLQVHPLVEYIQEQFNMAYTQEESYYILDVKEEEEPCVYLGFKNGIDKEEFFTNLEYANKNGEHFDAERYVNKIAVKKGDHVLIPAGTIHCSGKGTMILEISSTPYIFTFKLWDWERVGLDGIPRPTYVEHGKHVLDFDCDTDYVLSELVNQFERISDQEEKTGLHPKQFIETRRFETHESITHKTNNEFQMLNLVCGEQIKVSSPSEQFEDYFVAFAETFIIPAGVSEYTITPTSGTVTYIKAYVRT